MNTRISIRWAAVAGAAMVGALLLVGVLSSMRMSRGWERSTAIDGAALCEPKLIPALALSESQSTGYDRSAYCGAVLRDNHRLVVGSALVLDSYTQDPGHAWTGGDDTYEHLTLEILRPEFDRPIEPLSENMRLYYSAGEVGAVDRCAGRYGMSASGTVVLHRTERGAIQAELDLLIPLRDPREMKKLRVVRLRKTVTFVPGTRETSGAPA